MVIKSTSSSTTFTQARLLRSLTLGENGLHEDSHRAWKWISWKTSLSFGFVTSWRIDATNDAESETFPHAGTLLEFYIVHGHTGETLLGGKQNLENHLLPAKDHLLVPPGDLRTHLGWELERSDVPRWSLGFMRFFWSVRCGVPSLVDLMSSRLGGNNMISMGRLQVARLAASSLDRGCSTNRGLLRSRSHLFQLLVFLTYICFSISI